MDTLDEIKAEIRRMKPEIESRYPIRLLSIFGSFARGEQTPESDVDVLVEEGDGPLRLFDLFEIERQLSKRVGRPVELIIASELRSRLKPRIEAEAQEL
ncbi:MAG: nucleotidyltransferase family protein [Beijerinckiaceae bacterium]